MHCLTQSGKKAIANRTMERLVTGVINPYFIGGCDRYLAQQVLARRIKKQVTGLE